MRSSSNDALLAEDSGPAKSQARPSKAKHRYSLDVLTDGSEHTGHGTVFLTVSRPPSSSTITAAANPSASLDQDTLLARYALSGVSTLTSRLASDQSFKLSCVRAVFCPSCGSAGGKQNRDMSSFAGMPSLLLSLSNYSMNGRLIVVGDGSIERYMDHVADLVLKRRNYPELVTCVVPLPKKKKMTEKKREEEEEEEDTWWMVYQDEYIVVYGRMVRQQGGGEKETWHIVYIVRFVFVQGDVDAGNCGCFAVFPSGLDARFCPNVFKNLPEDISLSRGNCVTGSDSSMLQQPLDLILHLNPVSADINGNRDSTNSVKLGIHPHIRRNGAAMHLVTVPDNLPGCTDEGLLVQSLAQSRILNARLSCAFPFVSSYLSSKIAGGGMRDDNGNFVIAQRVESFTSVILELPIVVAHGHEKKASSNAFTIVNRRQCKMDDMRLKEPLTKDHDTLQSMDGNQYYSHRIQDVTSFYYDTLHNTNICHVGGDVKDDNEINLSDCEDESVDCENDNDSHHRIKRHKYQYAKDIHEESSLDKSVPYLMVLGTGCASPAPLRGSSGYAIFMPTIVAGRPSSVLSVVLECGEGYLTMLRRHECIHDVEWITHLSHIGLIWISHAHLDHYGDLPNLIHEIAQIKGSTRMCTCYDIHRQRGAGNPVSLNDKKQGETNIPVPACDRCHGTRPTVVIAPTKVLCYLEIALNCKNGFINGQKVYVAISHRDFDGSPFVQQVRDDVFGFHLPVQVDTNDTQVSNNIQRQYRPFQYLKNIQVEHCPDSYGCLLGLNVISSKQHSTKVFTLCYSGDTRPSSNLVRACQDYSKATGVNISLLLHEATFDDDTKGKEEATRKRHSTVQEAMSIANRIKTVDCLLLTHFSQRYPKFPPGHDPNKAGGELSKHDGGIPSASAFDGMLIPLKDGLGQILPQIETMATSILSE